MNYLAIDFGGTLVKYSVFDEEYEILLTGEKTAPVESKEIFAACIKDIVREADPYDICGIAVSMPGIIDSDHGFAVTGGAYTCLKQTDVRTIIQEIRDVPVYIENDGKCAALAEVGLGNLQDCENGVVIILGTAVAGGIIINKNIYKGTDFAAGEFSNMQISETPDFAKTAALQCGVATLLAKASFAKRIPIRNIRYGELFAKIMHMDLSDYNADEDSPYAEGMDGIAFFKELDNQDREITKLYHEYLDHIAQMIVNLRVILSPQRILIGGGISNQERLIPDIRKAYEKVVQIYGSSFDVSVDIKKCAFGSKANQYGALVGWKKQYLR